MYSASPTCKWQSDNITALLKQSEDHMHEDIVQGQNQFLSQTQSTTSHLTFREPYRALAHRFDIRFTHRDALGQISEYT